MSIFVRMCKPVCECQCVYQRLCESECVNVCVIVGGGVCVNVKLSMCVLKCAGVNL